MGISSKGPFGMSPLNDQTIESPLKKKQKKSCMINVVLLKRFICLQRHRLQTLRLELLGKFKGKANEDI